MNPTRLYLVAGETSGDNHGAALMRALRSLHSSIEFYGRGGPEMRAVAAPQFHDWVDEAGVLGLWEVIKHYNYFRREFRETLEEIAGIKPDAVILIDYPGFNLRLARALRRAGSARKIIYYISPQVWAWNRGRIVHMAQCLDLMLCIFPFEAELYTKSGLRARFVGHPMVESLRAQQVDGSRDAHLVGLFPGSRRREIRKIFPILIRVVRHLRHVQPHLHFEIAAASPELASEIAKMLKDHAADRGALQIKIGDSGGIMQRAGVGIVASGTATLEAAFFRMPFVIVYKVSWLTYLAARAVVRLKHIGMPNVLADREIVPEFIQHQAIPASIADAVLRLIQQPQVRAEMLANFDKIIGALGETDASRQAAAAILEEVTPVIQD